MELFFNYSIDCELPPNTEYTEHSEKRPFLHGPASWDFAQASVRGFVTQMEALGLRRGASLFVYPDVARHQKALFRELADTGIEVALHLNGLRYSRLKGSSAKWLGEMSYIEQRQAIEMGKQDLEQVIGRPCLGYRSCYGSANDDTFPICQELGFTWASNSSNRYRPEFAANWRGSWPFVHRPNRKCKLVVGDLELYEIPITVGLTVVYDEKLRQPLDLRVETPPTILGEQRQKLRQVMEEQLDEMQMRQVPVRTIIGASHNTSPYNDPKTYQAQNLNWLAKHARECSQAAGLEFVAAGFAEIAAEARRVNSY